MRMDITINNIDQSLVQRLSREAESRGMDVNAFLINVLSTAVPLEPQRGDSNLIEKLAGTWKSEEFDNFTSNTAPFEEIDESLWQ